jgi:hypothetical protein
VMPSSARVFTAGLSTLVMIVVLNQQQGHDISCPYKR